MKTPKHFHTSRVFSEYIFNQAILSISTFIDAHEGCEEYEEIKADGLEEIKCIKNRIAALRG